MTVAGLPAPAGGAAPLRPPEEVMRLARMGASFQTRLSFMRGLVRRMARARWRFERLRFDLDADGYGVSVLAVHTPERTYSLVAFTSELDPACRTDRVIAEAWDATFNLFDGVPDAADIARLAVNTPKQEAGRFLPRELVLARANKSVRLFEHVAARLAEGRQPDLDLVAAVGYLMRTTAVYGSGKFGCADRGKIADRPEMRVAFQAEMLCVYLIRWFTFELVEHIAQARGGAAAVPLAGDVKRFLGIGNATGLGMAPFLIKHPVLVHNWVAARETALARVRGLARATPETQAHFRRLLARATRHVAEWSVQDAEQSGRIADLRRDLARLTAWCEADGLAGPAPWDAVFRYAQDGFSLEGQELTTALLLEPHGDLVDGLADCMYALEEPPLEPGMSVGRLRQIVDELYGWALAVDFDAPEAQARFWYYSEDKLEPRFGDRARDPGADREMPLAVARDVSRLWHALRGVADDTSVGAFVLAHPEVRHAVRRVQIVARHPYAEIRDNLVGAEIRPIDLLRFKLAFFGATKFDPKSDLWTRITLYQGAPLPDELARVDPDGWAFPVRPEPAA